MGQNALSEPIKRIFARRWVRGLVIGRRSSTSSSSSNGLMMIGTWGPPAQIPIEEEEFSDLCDPAAGVAWFGATRREKERLWSVPRRGRALRREPLPRSLDGCDWHQASCWLRTKMVFGGDMVIWEIRRLEIMIIEEWKLKLFPVAVYVQQLYSTIRADGLGCWACRMTFWKDYRLIVTASILCMTICDISRCWICVLCLTICCWCNKTLQQWESWFVLWASSWLGTGMWKPSVRNKLFLNSWYVETCFQGICIATVEPWVENEEEIESGWIETSSHQFVSRVGIRYWQHMDTIKAKYH